MSLTRVDIDVCLTKNVPICYIITPWKYQVSQCGSKKLMRYWQFHIIKWKKSKVLSHLRDSRIETYLEKACYLGSLWLVGSQETQKWTKIKSALWRKWDMGNHCAPRSYLIGQGGRNGKNIGRAFWSDDDVTKIMTSLLPIFLIKILAGQAPWPP